jgi:hypothetical protein
MPIPKKSGVTHRTRSHPGAVRRCQPVGAGGAAWYWHRVTPLLANADHEAIAELVPGHISKVPGVLRTVTHIAFREYSQRDEDDAFSIGMQS